MPSWQESLIISLSLLKRIEGSNIVANPTALPIGVWPGCNSSAVSTSLGSGPRAEFVWIRPSANCYFRVDATPNTLGSALLAGGQEYPFALHPTVNTLYFLDAQSASSNVSVRWIIGR